MKQFQDHSSDLRVQTIQKTIVDHEGNQQQVTVRQTIREVRTRPGVADRKNWQKWGEVQGLPRGVHKEGDVQIEPELRIQAANNQEELNFVIPAAKTQFVVDFNEKQDQKPQKQDTATRGIGDSIQFPTGDGSIGSTWLLIISNLVQFEDAETFNEIIDIKDYFRVWLANELNQEEGRYTYYINFLQNKRRNRVFSNDKTNSHYPLIQKVMLKFPDKAKAEQAQSMLNGKSYDECILYLELQEQRSR